MKNEPYLKSSSISNKQQQLYLHYKAKQHINHYSYHLLNETSCQLSLQGNRGRYLKHPGGKFTHLVNYDTI